MIRNRAISSRKKLVIVVIVFILVLLFILLQLRNLVFQHCVTHTDHSKTHTHTQLKIIQDGREIQVPSNVAVTDACMHPLHTHDATGLIHMEFPLPFTFFLGDFFDVMGTKFSDTQIGSIRTFDGYTIRIKKNGKIISSMHRFISLQDLDKIEIMIQRTKK